MRLMVSQSAHLAVAFLLLTCLPGCSLFIRYSGTTLPELESRSEVEERFGPCHNHDTVDLIEPSTLEVYRFEVERYHVHRKFNTAMPMGAWGPVLLLYEAALTCRYSYEAAREIAIGHDLAFVYDQSDKVIGHQYPRSFDRLYDRSFNVLDWEEVCQ